MNRRDIDDRFRNHQTHSGSSPGQSEGFESPGQANQWHADSDRQAGGSWGQGSTAPDSPARQRESRSDHARSDHERAEYRSEAQATPRQGEYRVNRDDWRQQQDLRREQAGREREPVAPLRNYDAAYGNEFQDFTSNDYGGRDFYASQRPVGGGTPSYSYRPSYGPDYGGGMMRSGYYGSARDDHDESYGSWRSYGEQRGFLDRAGDEIASWFGDRDAAKRREDDHRGRGPADYTRSDERIREDANDALTHDRLVDARSVTVSVAGGEVTLDGTVESRQTKRRAEDVIENLSGVKHVQNNLRVSAPGTVGA